MTQSRNNTRGTENTAGVLNTAIGTRVRQLRNERGLTCADVERLSESRVWASHLSVLERGAQVWQAHHLEAVAAALGVHPRELLPPPEDAPPPVAEKTSAEVSAGELTPTEAELVVKLRNASPEALSLLAALAQATPEGRPAPPANTDHEPGSTRRKLEGLLDPRRMGGPKKRGT